MIRLTRVLPSGAVKPWPEPFASRRAAATVAAQCLYDNGVVTKREAQEFAARLYDATPGAMVAHGSGYRFYLEKVD